MNLILYNKIKFANCCATIVFKQIQGNLIKKGEDYMPLKIPAELPAYNVLSEENIFVMNLERASHQDIRPLKIGILNLMPIKIQAENQLLRYLSNTPLQVDITLLQTKSYTGNHTPL